MTTVTHFTFFIPHSPPTSSLSLTWPVLHSVLHCLSVWSLFKGFALAFHLQIYCTFISITPLLFSLAFPLTLCWSSAFNVFCCVLFLHRCNLFQHYSIILFSSPSCAYYPQTVPLLEKCLSIYVIWSWLYLWPLSFWTWLISLNMMTSSFIYLSINITISFFLWLKILYCMHIHMYTLWKLYYIYVCICIYIYNLYNPLISWKTSGLFMCGGYCQ
jgi:hypothetical protein